MWHFGKLFFEHWFTRVLFLLGLISLLGTYVPKVNLPGWLPWAILVIALLFASHDLYRKQQATIEKLQGRDGQSGLVLSLNVTPPDCHKTSWNLPITVDGRPNSTGTDIQKAPCYYFRVKITNTGIIEAQDVQLFAAELRCKSNDGEYEVVGRFTPMRLVWSHIRKATFPRLAPGTFHMCDLAHIIHPRFQKYLAYGLDDIADTVPLLAFDLEVQPNMKGHLTGPGVYQLTIMVTASRMESKEYTLEINYPGEWFDDEFKMLTDGFGMRLV